MRVERYTKTEKTPVEEVGTACLDVCESFGPDEQAPRGLTLTTIIPSESPLHLEKTPPYGLKNQLRAESIVINLGLAEYMRTRFFRLKEPVFLPQWVSVFQHETVISLWRSARACS